MTDTLVHVVVYLTAAVIAVPIFQRLRLGSILGYLAAGVVIGPFGIGFISHPNETLHLAELGVVLLLFVIGLELSPATLWRMRRWILLLGNAQVLGTAAVVIFLAWLLYAMSVSVAFMVGLALALSSTAFAVQLMKDYRILNTPIGQKAFSILLLQDLAVIPILLYVAALGGGAAEGPPWWIGVVTVGVVLGVGYMALNPFLRVVARWGSSELMTAAALLIVLGTALLVESAGLSMGLGAFLAGIMLANSSFRHQLETDIAPFQGILMGLFFIAIGMVLDINLLLSEPLHVFAIAVGLLAIKAVWIAILMKLSGSPVHDSIRIALMLAQGGEFAFVVLTQALDTGVIDAGLANLISLAVGISMALTGPLVSLYNLVLIRGKKNDDYDTAMESGDPEVIIAGFGRVGQITGRILAAHNIPFTALDRDAEHIEFVRQFGNRIFFGDATRLDLLVTAGIHSAKVMLVAVDDEAEALKIVEVVRAECPDIRIVSRAHNRVNLLKQRQAGADYSARELWGSSLDMAIEVLKGIGFDADRAQAIGDIFHDHDDGLIEEALKYPVETEHLIRIGIEGRKELERLFELDKKGELN